MERLTEYVFECSQIKDCDNFTCEEICKNVLNCGMCPISKAINKLAEYEDSEEQGLLLRLPCKVGDDVYYILGIPNETPCVIESCVFELSDIHRIGKTLFLTKEEAEQALAEMEGGVMMAQWNKNTVPKCEKKTHSDEVLVTVVRGTWKRVLKAVYIPFHHCTVEDLGWSMMDGVPDDWEYVEEEDTWWIPQGWYEVCDYFEDYSYSTITDKVVAWSKLPKPYEPRVSEFN